MASTILLRNIGGVDDKRIVLSNSNFARPFSVASGWTQLRIAMRLIMRNTGANLTSTPRFFAGLCSGSTNLPLDATTTHFVGIRFTSATWTYQVGPPVRYASLTANVAKKVNTTWTEGNQIFITTNHMMADATTTNRQFLFVDITKGSPNFTVTTFHRNNVTAGDLTVAEFLLAAPLAPPTVVNHTAGTGQTTAVNEGTDGTLDHVCVGWDRSTPEIEICDLAVVKLA